MLQGAVLQKFLHTLGPGPWNSAKTSEQELLMDVSKGLGVQSLGF